MKSLAKTLLSSSLWICGAALVAGPAGSPAAGQVKVELESRFAAAESPAWQLRRLVPGAPSLQFTTPEQGSGLRFASEGMDLLSHEAALGSGPFEVAADIHLTRGKAETFSRHRGLVISLSSAPVDAMGPADWSLNMVISQTGPLFSLTKSGARYAQLARPGLYRFPGTSLTERFQINMGGAGGQDFSLRWPTNTLQGTRMRFFATRKPGNEFEFKMYNVDGVAGPWWRGSATLPGEAATVPLKHITIHTGREAADFGDLSNFKLAVGQGNLPLDGVLERLAVRSLAETGAPRLDQPFPAAALAAPEGWQPRSVLLSEAQLAAQRAKFAAPAFAAYRTMILRGATPEALATAKYGTSAQNEALMAVLWAYILTGDKATYWDSLVAEIDALSNHTDKLPARQWDYPGELKQLLFIREFYVHNLAALALALDTVGPELDAARRDHIRYLLVRAMRSYHDLLDAGDWWYGQNPSNTIGVGNGAMGIVAVTLKEQQPELAQKTIDRALGNIRTLFLGVEPDGGSIEGTLYWQYGLSYPQLFGWALRQTGGDDQGMLSSPQVKNATRYVGVNFGGDGRMIPFNDSQPWLIGWPVLAAAGTEANDGLARWLADHMAREYAAGTPEREQARSTYTVPAFLYRDTVPAPAEFPGLPNAAHLESVQEAVLRSDGKQLVPGLVTGIKGKGANSTHHGNQDQGSFVLYAGGETFLLDPGYFEDPAQNHSLPLLGDAAKMTLAPTSAAPITGVFEAGDWRGATVDATGAYNGGKNADAPLAKRVRRLFVQHGAGALIVLDDVVPQQAGGLVTAQYQVAVPVTVEGSKALLKGVGTNVQLSTYGPALQLEARDRKFRKEWLYKRAGVPWSTVSGAYEANELKPLVSVFQPAKVGAAAAAPATVNYEDERIVVTIPGALPIAFIKGAGGWETERPRP